MEGRRHLNAIWDRTRTFFFPGTPCACYPTTNGGMQNGSSVGISTHCSHFFCTLGADFACSVGAYRQNFCIGARLEAYQECVVGRVRAPHDPPTHPTYAHVSGGEGERDRGRNPTATIRINKGRKIVLIRMPDLLIFFSSLPSSLPPFPFPVPSS